MMTRILATVFVALIFLAAIFGSAWLTVGRPYLSFPDSITHVIALAALSCIALNVLAWVVRRIWRTPL